MRRRVLLAGIAGGSAAVAAAGLWRAWDGPEPVRPPAPAGVERLERVWSAARGREVDFYTAVPHGHGDGHGLPVCLVLHGGAKRPPDFAALGLGGFLTDAVRRGTPPFVLAGATGDRLAWRPSAADDPQRMAAEEIPAWCAARGFDPARLAAWGWSMGGFGALLLAEARPGLLRAVAAFSPAVTPGDAVFGGITRLGDTPVGLWCGTGDPLHPNVRALHDALPTPPMAGGYGAGRHHFGYWSTILAPAFAFVGATLHASPTA
ncbi:MULTISPECIES: alpha/beta hydrolase [Catenuloplanes]|uniref:Pimeloyl-ACP methyl ester carboxylesterase n=1 Tax=Catenuloplanes niger TaxID=587534 RepID=A0AAE3ZH28_9ACTN|nr:alpha/beta hydrolase-fold protein [Catenuloplanes niger]MDR7319758.1 pimeloyl-ACP methyl ester carboxylesterase [Catenuloplanes niger]